MKNEKRTSAGRRAAAFCVALVMLIGCLPLPAMAAESLGEIQMFEPLAETAGRQVPLGTLREALALPETLTARVLTEPLPKDGAEAAPVTETAPETESRTEEVSVSWAAKPSYDPETAGSYVFTAALRERYALAAGVSMPQITVTVEGEAAGQPPAGAPETESVTPEDLRARADDLLAWWQAGADASAENAEAADEAAFSDALYALLEDAGELDGDEQADLQSYGSFFILYQIFLAQTGMEPYGLSKSGILTGSAQTLTNDTVYKVPSSMTIRTDSGYNALTVDSNATVVLYIPSGVNLTAYGKNGSVTTGGGAGIYIGSGATLIVTGGGTLYARGGDAGNGGGGGQGYSSSAGGGTGGGALERESICPPGLSCTLWAVR